MAYQETVVIRVNEVNPSWKQKDWLERGHQWWKASAARIIDCAELFVLDAKDRVMAVARVAGVEKDLDEGRGRISIIYREFTTEHELIGKTIRRPGSRNPVVDQRDIEVIHGGGTTQPPPGFLGGVLHPRKRRRSVLAKVTASRRGRPRARRSGRRVRRGARSRRRNRGHSCRRRCWTGRRAPRGHWRRRGREGRGLAR